MKSDLVVVVADGGIEQAIRGILSKPRRAGIRQLSGVEFPKLHKLDQGAYAQGHELAALYRETHEHALVVFDFAWEGRPTDDPGEMLREVEDRLQAVWANRGRCIIIVPELEVWVWSESPHVARALGWNRNEELRNWLESSNLWHPGDLKPFDPKKAYEQALREKKMPKSNATFFELAQNVSFQRCQDAAFQRLLQILRDWFPVEDSA